MSTDKAERNLNLIEGLVDYDSDDGDTDPHPQHCHNSEDIDTIPHPWHCHTSEDIDTIPPTDQITTETENGM